MEEEEEEESEKDLEVLDESEIHNKVISGFQALRQGAGSGARTRDRRVPADLRADSQATVLLPTPPKKQQVNMNK
ncbi:hypothetical protein PoB_005758100 [Plakobranchus ocellatus]|uniref:Uncharacterized protein n=1 Tax=Plakobranchus ocellatus TaxID=259542 RepID=A0AAV4C707_9GAST|nr:hypothetical protein PoB_005758100 [Plakobranchus ocellatus]